MAYHLIKLEHDKYVEWSTVVDAPILWVMSKDELLTRNRQNLLSRTYTDNELWSLEGINSTSLRNSRLDLLSNNRAGPNESRIHIAEIIKRYKNPRSALDYPIRANPFKMNIQKCDKYQAFIYSLVIASPEYSTINYKFLSFPTKQNFLRILRKTKKYASQCLEKDPSNVYTKKRENLISKAIDVVSKMPARRQASKDIIYYRTWIHNTDELSICLSVGYIYK